jgi:lipid-binding SYLF domain-containing protein
MTTARVLFLAFMTAIMLAGRLYAGWDPADEVNAKRTIEMFREGDPSLDRFFSKAYGYAVYSDVYKGGFLIIGGGYGKGLVFEQGNLVGRSKLTMLNVGPQLGGQGFSEIVFFRDQSAFDNFTKGNYELSAQFGVVLVKTGIATNTDYSDGVAVFVMPKAGLMGEISIGGQRYSYEPGR